MVAIKALTVLALAGAISAAPTRTVGEALVRRDADPEAHRGEGGPQNFNYNPYSKWTWQWDGKGPGDQAQPSAAPAASEPATAPQTPPSSGSAPSSGSDYNSPPPSSGSAPSSGSDSSSSPATSSTPSTGSGGGVDGYMGVVSTWRSKMGLPALTEDSTLESNAQDTSNSSGGQLKHKLNPGSMAQVLAPGNDGNFESVFVGGWLCEMPQLSGLGSGVCNDASKGWDHAGQTGHAEILSSTKYTKIGCALGDGIWACDLA